MEFEDKEEVEAGVALINLLLSDTIVINLVNFSMNS